MKKLILIFSICTFAWLGVGGCGDDDCTVCPDDPPPAEPDYHLLYSYVGQWPDNYVLTYSTKSGKVIDSAYYHGSMFKSMDFSHDGRYACYTDDYHGTEGYSETWVTDTQTGDTVSYVRGVGAMAVVISPNDQFALLSGSHFMAVVRLPSLEVVLQDSVDSWVGRFDRLREILYISLQAALDSMYVINFESVPPVWKSFPIAFYDGTPAQSLGPICVTDSLLVLQSFSGQRGYLQIYNLSDYSLAWQSHVTPESYLGVALHPTTNRLYLAYNGGFDRPTGGIDILDLNTRVFRNYINPGELDLGYDAFVPSHLDITPDGEALYVLNGDHGFWLGPILEIELATKEVARRIDNHDGNSWYMRLNPKNWAE